MKLIAPIVMSLFIGFGLGSIPVINQYLHWNIWIIVPVSGLGLGAGLAWIQFFACYLLNQRADSWRIIVLALAASTSYLAIDFGIYHATSIPVQGVEGVPDGNYRLAELISFPRYMQGRLGSSSLTMPKHEDKSIEIGATGTTVSFLVDLAGAFVAAAGTLLFASSMYPYCGTLRSFQEPGKEACPYVSQ